MEIYIIKELSILSSGEKSVYATPFQNEQDAYNERNRIIEEWIDMGYEEYQRFECKDSYIDTQGNYYEISIESKCLQ